MPGVDTWQSVTLAEELMGVLRAMLSLPQYLMTAMLVGAEQVTHRRESITGAIAAAAAAATSFGPYPYRCGPYSRQERCPLGCCASYGMESRSRG